MKFTPTILSIAIGLGVAYGTSEKANPYTGVQGKVLDLLYQSVDCSHPANSHGDVITDYRRIPEGELITDALKINMYQAIRLAIKNGWKYYLDVRARSITIDVPPNTGFALDPDGEWKTRTIPATICVETPTILA